MATIYRAYANGEEITDFPINGVNTKEIWGGDTLLWVKRAGNRKNIADFAVYDKCETENGTTLVNIIYTNYSPRNFFAIFTGSGELIKIIDRFDDYINAERAYAVAYKNNFYIIHTDIFFRNIIKFYKYSEEGALISYYKSSESLENMYVAGFFVSDDDSFNCIVYHRSTNYSEPYPDVNIAPTVYKYKNGKIISTIEIEKESFHNEKDFISNQYQFSGKMLLESTRFEHPYYSFPFIRPLLEINSDKISLFDVTEKIDNLYYNSYTFLGAYNNIIYLTGKFDYSNYGSFVCSYDGSKYELIYSSWKDTDAPMNWRRNMKIEAPCVFFKGNMFFWSNPYVYDEISSSGIYKLNLSSRKTPALIYEIDENEKITTRGETYTFSDIINLTVANGNLYVHKSFSGTNTTYERVYTMDEVVL